MICRFNFSQNPLPPLYFFIAPREKVLKPLKKSRAYSDMCYKADYKSIKSFKMSEKVSECVRARPKVV